MVNKMKKKDILALSTVLIIVAVLLVVVFFIVKGLLGNTSIKNNVTSVEETQSLKCESDEVKYALLDGEIGDKGSIKINAVFNDDKLSVVSLEYKMYFDDRKSVDQDEARTRVIMNRRFADDGLPADALGVNYTRLDDAMQLNLYAKVNELNSSTVRYFMLEDAGGHYSYNSVKKVYADLGLKCVAEK